MTRRSDDSLPLIAAFACVAIVVIHILAQGTFLLIKAAGGFGLAERYFEPFERDQKTVELDLDVEVDGQVVDTPRPDVERVPLAPTKFLAAHNQAVERETKAPQLPRTDARREAAMRSASVSSAAPTPAPAHAKRPGEPPPDPSPVVKHKDPEASLLTMRTDPDAPAPPRREPGESPWKKKLSLGDLRPADSVLQPSVSRAHDYLKDIDNGTKTLLNTKEWKFATFFNRVKRQLEQHWHPDREYRRRDPQGNIYGFKTRVTHLHVLLKPSGSLHKIIIEKPCGLGFLDDEAVRAFRKAAPFPNPPRRLVSKRTGLIAFRFGFIFEIARAPKFRLFRLGR